jgi:hypothetical protein
LDADSKEKEKKTIKHILQANKYDTSMIDVPLKNSKQNTKNDVRWAKFTYTGKEMRFITKLFKNSKVNISYTTRNTIASLLSQNLNPKKNKFEHSVIYQLTCQLCVNLAGYIFVGDDTCSTG